MAARAIWKGIVKIGSAKVPVKLYSAVTDRTVRFHVLDDRSKMRIKQHMINPDSGDEVPTEEIQKGYELEPGRFVILTEEDLKSIEPEPSREIEIGEFVPPGQISQQWYQRPYYLGPDGDQKAYFALAEALKETRAGRCCALGDAQQSLRRCTAGRRRLFNAGDAAQRGGSYFRARANQTGGTGADRKRTEHGQASGFVDGR